MTAKSAKSLSPSYYIRKRLFKNKPAVFGMVVIVLLFFTAISAYLIMPDPTPSANDGDVRIARKQPGFEVTLLKIPKKSVTEKRGFFHRLVSGKPSPYSILPISKYTLEGFEVKAEVFDQPENSQRFHLTELVLPPGFVNSGEDGNEISYKIQGEIIFYKNKDGSESTVSRKELISLFKEQNIEQRKYFLGTDRAGRDMLSRLLFGARISLAVGFLSVLIALAIGVTLGAAAGYFGGKTDAAVSWLMTVVWSVPGIMLVIAISLALQSKGLWVIFTAVGMTTWPDIARVVRGQMMSLKESGFAEAARALGFRKGRIIFNHLLPNMLGPVIVATTANFAAAVLIESGLSFLGLGVQPPVPSWGIMVSEGFRAVGSPSARYLVVFPSLCIFLTVLAFNLFGNGLRDAFDPSKSPVRSN